MTMDTPDRWTDGRMCMDFLSRGTQEAHGISEGVHDEYPRLYQGRAG